MIEKYYDQSIIRHQYGMYRDITYASCLEYVRKNGIKAKIHFNQAEPVKPVTAVPKKNNKTNIPQTHIKDMEYPGSKTNSKDQDKQSNESEGLFGRGLFHYRKWWERNEADIFVNGDKLTGIPIFTDKNTLRVINDNYSYFIPLEKVDYIRTSDGLKTCSSFKTTDTAATR